MLVTAEDTVICVDNSVKLVFNLDLYDDLVRAVLLYAHTKLESYRFNHVGVMALASGYYRLFQHPSRYAPAYTALKCLRRGGLLDLGYGLQCAYLSLQTPHTKATKRILLFVVSPFHHSYDLRFFKTQGRMLNQLGVAIDVVSFNESPSVDTRRNALLQAFVDAANHNGNSHILHVPPNSSICDSLSRDPDIFPPRKIWMKLKPAPRMEDDKLAIMKNQKQVVNVEPSRKGKNQARGMEDDNAIMEKQENDVNVEPSGKGKNQHVEAHGMNDDKLATEENQENDVNVEPSRMDNHSINSPKGKKVKTKKGKKRSSRGRRMEDDKHVLLASMHRF